MLLHGDHIPMATYIMFTVSDNGLDQSGWHSNSSPIRMPVWTDIPQMSAVTANTLGIFRYLSCNMYFEMTERV